MKIHLYLLFILLPIRVFCQNADTTSHAKQSRLSIGILFSPEYSYRTISPDQSASSQEITTSRNSTEIYRITYSAGIICVYQLNKKITLSIGTEYSDKGYKTKSSTLFLYNPTINPRTGTVSSSSTGTATFIYHYYYIDIPIKASYYFIAKRVKIYVSLGLSTNINLSDYNTATLDYSDGTTTSSTEKTNNGFSTINLQAIAGVGTRYDLSRKLYIMVEPTFNYSINSIVQAPIREYLYSFGLNTSVSWKF
ncbi:MAG TPA: outer membrane beta-barrel protein [Bacteroidia bacterium]|jgi:hypothetical protein|nr:outer membrane beta-barrel protein [Bacteroidia bacterium]